jgi:hypothetical protein
MTVTVTKIAAFAARGPSANCIAITKIVAYPIVDSNTLATPVATVKKRVGVRGRIIYGAS